MGAEKQIELLANFIMAEIEGEPSKDGGAGDCAVRIIKKYRKAMMDAINNIGVPQPGYIAPVAEAYEILANALHFNPEREISEEALGQ